MRLSLRIFATAAVAVLLMPTLLLRAAEAAKPGTTNDMSFDSSVSSASEPAAPVTADSQPMAMPNSQGRNFGTPRVELFLGYSYLRAVPAPASGNRMEWLNGGSTSIALNLNRYLGLVGDFGGFADSHLLLSGTGGNPSTVVDSSGRAYTYLFGPRLSFRNHTRLTPFAQVLFGGMHASEVTLSGCSGAGCTPLPSENKFTWTAGGGLDIRVHQHFAIRIIQAEYLRTSFEDHGTGENATQNDMRLSSGIVFRFGGSGAQRLPELGPLTYSCSVTPPAVFPGDAISVSGTALNLNPAKTPEYTWSVDGGTVSGVTSTARIDTTNLAVGTYTLKGHVSEGAKPGENADCTATYAVKAYEPPTVSCSANPVSVISGDSSTITAAGVSPQNRSLTYSYSATSGSVKGAGSTAVLSTVGSALGVAIVTCNVVDDKGQTASGTTSVTVAALPVAPKPVTSNLCTVQFARDAHRPARVDNEGKACLDQTALNLQQNTDAKVAIVGNASTEEKGGRKLASERAINTIAYLVGEKGVDSSRIAIYAGSLNEKTVSTTLIPSGATFDTTGDTAVDESSVKVHRVTPAQHNPK
jgi:opacity protein-like surface antigen